MAGERLAQLLTFGQEPEALSQVYEAGGASSSTSPLTTRSLRFSGVPAPKSPFRTVVDDLGRHVGRGIAIPETDVTSEIAPGVVFRHYARDHFARFRAMFGISELAYQQSLASLEGGATQESGKSGSLFFFSSDGLYILKTVSRGEKDKLLAMLPDYLAHVSEAREAGRPCLLSRFYGVYSVSFGQICGPPRAGGNALHLLAMDNVFSGARPDRIYDLKGTTEDRFVEPEEGRVMKDLNFEDRQLLLPMQQARSLLEAIRLDTAFLEEEDIMDYSLILGVFEGDAPPTHNGQRGILAGSELVDEEHRPAAFQMAIIDTLISWSVKKKAAYWLKKPTLGCCHEIDTEPPEYYRERFVEYFEEKVAFDSA